MRHPRAIARLALTAVLIVGGICIAKTMPARAACVEGVCAGDDGGVHGGSCATDEAKQKDWNWWDTCHGGVWRRYEVTSDSIHIPDAGGVDGGYVTNCLKVGATHFYRLALVEYKAKSGYSNYSGNQKGLLPVHYWTPAGGYSKYGSAIYKDGEDNELLPYQPTWDHAKQLYNFAMAYLNSIGADASVLPTWSNTSWFCWNKSWAGFSSKTNVWLNQANSVGIKSVTPGNGLVSSGYNDNQTDTPLEVTVEAGGKVAIDFNSYLKTENKAGGKTKYKVKHVWNCGYDFCKNFYNESFIPEWHDYETTDGQEHSAITYANKDTHYMFEIPDNVPAGSSYLFCEYIDYKKTNDPNAATGSTHACVKITIGEGTIYEGKSKVTSGESKDSGWGTANTAPTLGRTVQSSTSGAQQISVDFNHYLRALSATPHSTDWTITRTTFTQTGSGITVTSTPNPLTDSGHLETSDTLEHPVGGTRTYNINIAANIRTISTIKICETLTFKTTPAKTTEDGWTKACFELTVTPAPTPGDCPVDGSVAPAAGTLSYGQTKVYAGARNFSVSTFNSYRNTGVYAKIQDNIRFAHCYYPEAQAVMSTYAGGVAGHKQCEGPGCDGYADDGYAKYVATKNRYNISTADSKVIDSGTPNLSPASYYNFSATGGFSVGGTSRSVTFTGVIGNTTMSVAYSHGSGTYNIRKGSAGTLIKQTITSDGNGTNTSSDATHSWCKSMTCTCPCSQPPCSHSCCCSVSHTNYYTGTSSGSPSDSAWIYIPYNFNTALGTKISGTNASNSEDTVVLADEKVNVSTWVEMTTRRNSSLSGTYATEPTPDTKIEVVSFFIKDGDPVPAETHTASTGPCGYYGNSVNQCTRIDQNAYPNRNSWMGTNWPSPSGQRYDLRTFEATVPNIPVGYKFCTSIGISHDNSDTDFNGYTGPGGSVTVSPNWHISGATCRTVANRPSLQVWGDDTYTNGRITTALNNKLTPGRLFGSWDEFALIVGQSGSIDGMSSGAAIGYDNAYTAASGKGGANGIPLYKNRSPLSIATVTGDSPTGTVRPSDISASGDSLKTRLISRYVTSARNKVTFPGSVNLSYYLSGFVDTHSENYTANPYRLTIFDTNASVTASIELGRGTTHIIYAKGNLNINSDILVAKGTRDLFNNIYDIPQYVFIVEGAEVNIAGNVSEIDAWIIAPNARLDTCAGYSVEGGGANTTNCGNKLTINGPVVVKSLSSDRTAGAGAMEQNGYYHQGTSGPAVNWNDAWGADPSELYNLSLTSYLWAYAQATRFSQNNTVYTRELAPRL